MSAPTSHDPLVVNTRDGICWKRQHVDGNGRGLYALADVATCPAYVLTSFDELAERGIVEVADALPMPVGPEPRTLDVVENELTGARLSLYEEELETARLRLALASAQRGRRQARETVRQMVEALNCYDCPPPGEAPLDTATRWRGYVDAAEARVAELLAERHVTNEALDDAVQALRARPVVPEREPEFHEALHHDYKPGLGRDLPETGGKSADRVVAYRSPVSGNLYCRLCSGSHDSYTPLTSDDLPDGGVCVCGADVLIDPKSGGAR